MKLKLDVSHTVQAVLLGIAAAALGLSAFLFVKWQDSEKRANDPQSLSRARVTATVEKIRKYMDLPNEEPSLATVTDTEKLSAQPFFAKAKVGDEVLIYQGAKLAVLYDPKANRVLNVAPVNIGTPSAQIAQSATFYILNGTPTTGAAQEYEQTLLTRVPSARIAGKGNAARSDYTSSFLVDVTGLRTTEAAEFSKVLNIPVGLMPPDESSPSADFLIVLGSDAQ